MTEITVGSAAFFGAMEGYKAQVTDKVALVPQVKNSWWQHVSTKDRVRLFHWQRHTVGELAAKLAAVTDCKRVSTLLVPEFAAAIKPDGTSDADYLAAIAPAIGTLCDRHAWAKTVYEAYVANGKLELTDEQRQAAYEEYGAARRDGDSAGRVNPNNKNAHK